jgi:hypothetical protein
MQRYSAVNITDEMATALSCGIEVRDGDGVFYVELSTDSMVGRVFGRE